MNSLTTGYEEARSVIQSGDLISFVPNDCNIIHNLTQIITKSPYYHSGVAVWMRSGGGVARLFVCEAQRAGRRLVPMSLYKGHKMDVLCCPVEFSSIEESLLTRVGSVPYGFLDYWDIGVRLLFGVTRKDAAGEVCSEMAQKEYAIGGFAMPDYVLSPGELYKYLVGNGVPSRVLIR